MLLRKQVMMTHWLDDHIKLIAEEYDISYSEVVRLATSFSLALMAIEVYPECKKYMNIDVKEAGNYLKEFRKTGDVETNYKFFSDWYFEARKIFECRQQMGHKESKKKKKES